MKKTNGVQFHKKHPFLAMLLVALMLFCTIQILDAPTIYADPTTDETGKSDDAGTPGSAAGSGNAGAAGVADGSGAANGTGSSENGVTGNTGSGSGTESSTGTTEAKTPSDEKDVTAQLLNDEYGRIVFWEWDKVTPQNYRDTFLKELKESYETTGNPYAIQFDNMNYRASMLVYHDADMKPKGFISLYDDTEHLYRSPYRAMLGSRTAELEGGDEEKIKAFKTALNQSTWSSVSGMKITDSMSESTFYPKLDSEGTSYSSDVWDQDNFFTPGAPKGVLWMRAISTRKNGFMFGGDELTYVRDIQVQTALMPASARNNTADMFYNSIGKDLNGNSNLFIGFNQADHYYEDEYDLDQDHVGGIMLTDQSQQMVKSRFIDLTSMDDTDDIESYERTSMHLERANGNNISCFHLYPYGAEEDTDKWIIGETANELSITQKIKGGLLGEYETSPTVISQYLAVKNGYLFGIDAWYFSTQKTKKGNTLYRCGKEMFNQFADPTLNMVFTWYVGTPHVFASIRGEGGNEETGEGGVTTIKNGEILVLSEAKYLDVDGNEALSEGVVLPESSSIVIEEGGILSIEGNFINDGKIINKGGTIIVKDGGCISPFGVTKEATIECCKGEKTGRAADLIIMPGGKLVALTSKDTYQSNGAVPALDLKDGSTLINYGTFATSYTRVTVGSKIENRKDGVIFAGYNRDKNTVFYYKANITKDSMQGLEPIPPKSANTNVGIKGIIIAARYNTYVEKNMGTLVVEPTSTLNHKNGTADYADPYNIEIVTPEY